MEHYNRLLSSRILDNYEDMIEHLRQPTMFYPQDRRLYGGKRMRNFVLPGSTDYDYPGSLSVGRMDGTHAQETLGGEFWKDFGSGFPVGGKREVREVPEEQKEECGEMEGGKKKGFLKGAIKVIKPIAMELAKVGIKEGVKALSKKSSAPAPAPVGSGRKPDAKKILNQIGKEIGKAFKKRGRPRKADAVPEAEASFVKPPVHEARDIPIKSPKIIVHEKEPPRVIKEIDTAPFWKVNAKLEKLSEEGKENTPEYDRLIDEWRRLQKANSEIHQENLKNADPEAYAEMLRNREKLREMVLEDQSKKKKGGFLVKDNSKVIYPPDLKQHSQGGKREKKTRKPSPRGQLISKLMKEKGMSLGQASKYIKENKLY